MLRVQSTSATLLQLKKLDVCVRWMRRKVSPPGPIGFYGSLCVSVRSTPTPFFVILPPKPPNLPPSKQTRYQVVHVPWMKPEDVKELLWRRHAYNHAVISIREQFKRDLQAKANSGEGIALLKKQELEEFNLILKANAQENKKLAMQRKERERLESEETRQNLLDELENYLKSQEQFVAERSNEVKQMIADSESFVTLDNLDEKLTEALENPVVHDFAIDLSGRRLSNPPPVKYLEGTPPRQKARIYDTTLGDIVDNKSSASYRS